MQRIEDGGRGLRVEFAVGACAAEHVALDRQEAVSDRVAFAALDAVEVVELADGIGGGGDQLIGGEPIQPAARIDGGRQPPVELAQPCGGQALGALGDHPHLPPRDPAGFELGLQHRHMGDDLTGGDQHMAISPGQPTRGGQHQLKRLARLALGHPRTGQATGQHHGGGHVAIRLAHLGHQLGQLTRCRSIRRCATRRVTALGRIGRAVISHGLTPAVASPAVAVAAVVRSLAVV